MENRKKVLKSCDNYFEKKKWEQTQGIILVKEPVLLLYVSGSTRQDGGTFIVFFPLFLPPSPLFLSFVFFFLSFSIILYLIFVFMQISLHINCDPIHMFIHLNSKTWDSNSQISDTSTYLWNIVWDLGYC